VNLQSGARKRTAAYFRAALISRPPGMDNRIKWRQESPEHARAGDAHRSAADFGRRCDTGQVSRQQKYCKYIYSS
jgi:hypothetical protein